MSDLCNISRSKLRFTKYLLGIQGTKHLALVSKNHLALDNHLDYYKMGPPEIVGRLVGISMDHGGYFYSQQHSWGGGGPKLVE